MAIDITTISVEMDTTSLKAGQVALNDTAKAGDKLAASATGAGKAAKAGFDDIAKAALKSEQATAQASVGMTRLRGIAQNAGYQLQDVAVQAQMGESAFTILGQQGSQFASAFGPTGAIVGAVLAVGTAVGGVLFKSFMAANEAMEEMTENTKKLVKQYKDFSNEQQKIINQGLSFTIADQTEKYNEQNKMIDEQLKKIKELNAEQGKTRTIITTTSFGAQSTYQQVIDNTKKIKEEEKLLNAVRQQNLLTQKEIEALQDPSGASAKIKAIQDEAALVGLVGEAYWEVKAAQEGITGAAQKEYIANNLLLEAKLKAEKEKQDAIKKTATEAEKSTAKLKSDAEKAQKAEEARATQMADMAKSIERETYLMGEQSKEAQVRYEIEQGILKVKGGIVGAEAQAIINAARANDIKRDQLKYEEDLHKKIQSDIEEQTQWAIDSVQEWADEAEEQSQEISRALTDALMRGFENGKGYLQNLKDATVNMFKTLVIKPVIQPIMDKAAGAIQGLMKGLSSSAGNVLAGAAIVGSLWNDYMEKDFKELTSEFRQSRQSTGTLLGNANAKSDSINKALSEMSDNGASLLDVNHGMYQALLDIRTGIAGSAAGFARQSLGANAAAGINTGTKTSGAVDSLLGATGIGIVGKLLGGTVGGFIDSLLGGISKAIYSKKTSVIDSGIQIIGSSLADMLEAGMVGAMNYAEVKTTKKVLGLTTSVKVKTQTSELEEEFKIQFAKVFEGAGDALEQASKVFGATFDASKLMIDATKLSLKGLEGDALTKEIESFFSATLDKWAGSLVDGLAKFQEVGEGAFETMIRLASQTNIFTSYAEKLLPKFNLVGLAAIEVTQAMADLSGGFDRLNTNMASYYQNFFDESEKSQRGLAQISDALASVGLTMPKTREEFRAMVEKLDLTSEAQQKQYAALLDVNQAFAQYVPATKAAEDATNSLSDTFDAIADQQKALSDKLFEMTATVAQKQQAALDAALSDENRAIQKQINDIENLNAAKAAQAEIDSEAYSLETQRLTLLGDTKTLRERELALINPANRAKQEEIWALEDAKAAAEEAARAQEQMAQAARDSAEEQKRLMQGVHDSITNALKSLMGQSDTFKNMTQAQARMTLQGALMTAKSGGSLVGYAGLEDALSAIQQEGTYGSAAESRLAIGRNIGLLSELAKYTNVNGSHANGLDYVPFDGYVAQLHKGERVQTASEAKSNGELAAKVDRLIEVVNAGNIAIAQNTAKSAKIAEKWDNDGSPETRSVA